MILQAIPIVNNVVCAIPLVIMADQEPQEPKPKFTPNPNKGWYTPPSESPQKLHEGDDEPHQTDQEIQFRTAAIKCAQMEDELVTLMQQNLNGARQAMLRGVQIHADDYTPSPSLQTIVEDIKGIEDGWYVGKVLLRFNGGFAKHAKDFGIETDKTLLLGLHTDEPTRGQFNEYAKEDPKMASYAETYYYFTPDGNYAKCSLIPSTVLVTDGRQPLAGYERATYYKSEMTPGDFEIAGQALNILIKRLKPQEEPVQ